jgi:SAM-dependent methyltransferase
MFNNLITLHDLSSLLSVIKRAGLGSTLQKIAKTPQNRVKQTWQTAAEGSRHWWSIPAVQKRVNRMITGDEDRPLHEHVAATFLADRNDYTALSLGCGAGSNELAWFGTGSFSTIDACDVSTERIALATARARELHVDDRLRFFVSDMFDLQIRPAQYDVIIFQDALHHLAPVRRALELANTWMADDGILVLKEYVGPDRFQWSERQLEVVNDLLPAIPRHLRSRWPDGKIKTCEYRPGRLSIYLHDPSEAAESSIIPDAVRSRFRVVDDRPYGGTVLHLAFKDIAHNFHPDTPEVQQALSMCFEVEDRALQSRQLPSDFRVLVGRAKR